MDLFAIKLESYRVTQRWHWWKAVAHPFQPYDTHSKGVRYSDALR